MRVQALIFFALVNAGFYSAVVYGAMRGKYNLLVLGLIGAAIFPVRYVQWRLKAGGERGLADSRMRRLSSPKRIQPDWRARLTKPRAKFLLVVSIATTGLSLYDAFRTVAGGNLGWSCIPPVGMLALSVPCIAIAAKRVWF
jgi:hypothetical protein